MKTDPDQAWYWTDECQAMEREADADIAAGRVEEMTDEFNDEDLRLAKLAYEVYGDTTGGKNYAGLPMPTWDDLPETIKEAWINAAVAVAYDQNGEYEDDRLS